MIEWMKDEWIDQTIRVNEKWLNKNEREDEMDDTDGCITGNGKRKKEWMNERSIDRDRKKGIKN
jgi:hypothetical protein